MTQRALQKIRVLIVRTFFNMTTIHYQLLGESKHVLTRSQVIDPESRVTIGKFSKNGYWEELEESFVERFVTIAERRDKYISWIINYDLIEEKLPFDAIVVVQKILPFADLEKKVELTFLLFANHPDLRYKEYLPFTQDIFKAK